MQRDEEGPRIYNTPVTVIICSTQNLVLNITLQWKEPRLLGEMTDYRNKVEYTLGESGASYSARKWHIVQKNNKQINLTIIGLSERHRSKLKDLGAQRLEQQNEVLLC